MSNPSAMNAYLNTPVIYNQRPSKVDKEQGIIHDVIVTSIGEAKGHNFKLNENFISEVVRLGNEHAPGVKARFGHPNICSTALGTYLGRFKNFRRVDNSAIADMHLDEVSKKSPKGNLYEYVLDMAESNPDMFGASIAFKHGKFKTVFKEIDGKKVEQKFATIESLYATDFVDSPAATDGLFEVFHEDDFAYQVTSFLDENPQIFQLLDSKPELITQFLDKYKSHKSMNFKEEIEKLKNWVSTNFSKKPDEADLAYEEAMKSSEELRKVFEQKLTNLESKYNDEDLSTRISELQTLNTELKTKNSDLETQLNQLKATPSTPNIKGDPQLSVNPKDKDETGKVLLSELPLHLRKKLKTTKTS